MNPTCVELRITSTYIPCCEGVCVCLSPSGSSINSLVILEDARITDAFNSVFLFIAYISTIYVIMSHLSFNYTTSSVR